MFYLRQSKRALIISSIFLFFATLSLVLHLYSMQTNPQDNGMSAVFLVLFTLPWISWIPEQWTTLEQWQSWVYPISIGLILWNAFLLYLITGGLGIKRS